MDGLFDDLFIELQGIAHPERPVSGPDEYSRGDIRHTEYFEALVGMKGHEEPFVQIGTHELGDLFGILLGDDNDADALF